MKPDYELISRSLQDVVAEPVRSLLIPGFDLIKQKALDAGALGCGISGSGPTIFALSTERQLAVQIGKSCQEEFARLKLHSEVYVSKINTQGAKVID